MNNINAEQKDFLCDTLAKIVFNLKKYNNIECITIQENNNKLIFRIIIKTNSLSLDLNEEVKKYNAISSVNEKSLGTQIIFTFDESCYYNNILDNNYDMNEKIKDSFCNSIILYERSFKYSKLKKALSSLEDNIDLPLYNIRKETKKM